MPRKKPIRSTTSLELTPEELAHLRDIMSVLISQGTGEPHTVSQVLATMNGAGVAESSLWSKVVAECKLLGLPLGDDAHDFAVTLTNAPMTVVNIRGTS